MPVWPNRFFLILLGVILTGAMISGCGQNTLFSEEDGKPDVWTVNITVPYSSEWKGQIHFVQTRSGTLSSRTDLSESQSFNYPTAAGMTSYSINLKNLRRCDKTCGFVYIRICSHQDQQCKSLPALKDFGVIEASAPNIVLEQSGSGSF